MQVKCGALSISSLRVKFSCRMWLYLCTNISQWAEIVELSLIYLVLISQSSIVIF